MEAKRPHLPVSFIIKAVVVGRIAPDREFQDESWNTKSIVIGRNKQVPSGVFKLKCYSYFRYKENVLFLIHSLFFFPPATSEPGSTLTNNCPSNQSKSNSHTGASCLVAPLRSDRPVCVLAHKVERVDQPKQRGEEITRFWEREGGISC